MKFIPTELPGVVVIEPAVFGDDRGWFYESFSQPKFDAGLQGLGLPQARPLSSATITMPMPLPD